jgi:hypothetical protein
MWYKSNQDNLWGPAYAMTRGGAVLFGVATRLSSTLHTKVRELIGILPSKHRNIVLPCRVQLHAGTRRDQCLLHHKFGFMPLDETNNPSSVDRDRPFGEVASHVGDCRRGPFSASHEAELN